MTTTPDIFSNVHKGIRKALFEACVALGRAGADEERQNFARGRLRDALHFVAHHGENEDLLLLPMLERRLPEIFARIRRTHAAIDAELSALGAQVDLGDVEELHLAACAFTSLYLEHMREEEQDLEPRIRSAIPSEELAAFPVRAVERTAPADARMMLGFMLPAMTAEAAVATLAKMPPEVSTQLRPLAGL